jgi:stearoyl-CoA desaturase (Delta-9 desaturase)
MILKDISSSTTVIAFHILTLVGIFVSKNISNKTFIVQFILLCLSMIGITGGYHRLWSHRSYSAHPILELFYLIFGTMASQFTVIDWTRSHRTHHRLEEKPGDPYNITKGLFHAHVGWILFPPDKKELEELSKTDISDLEHNKWLKFQEKHYLIIWFLLNFGVTYIIMKQWGESNINIFFTNIFRIVICLNLTWCINSFAHYYGDKPYRNDINASDNTLLGILTLGEGWHNYHHSYPKDYRASEPNRFNITTMFINLTRILGLSHSHYYRSNQDISIKDRFIKTKYSILK